MLLVDGLYGGWVEFDQSVDHQICKETPNKLFHVPDICNEMHCSIVIRLLLDWWWTRSSGLGAQIFEILSNGIKWSPLASVTSLKEVKI